MSVWDSTGEALSATGLPGGPDVLTATVPAGRLNPPAAGDGELRRPRLHGALSAAVAAAPLTVVTGPTGSGKTVLAAGWARAQARRVAWLTVCPVAAGSAAGFWAAVAAALRRAGVGLATPVAPPRGGRVPPGYTVRLATQLAALPHPVVLVIDNADGLTRPDILEPLDLLAEHAGARLRLVLLGRADPLLPMHTKRAAGRLAEIRAEELTFRPEEMRALLARLGAPVGEPDAAALATATGGWSVTVPLLAALLRRGADAAELAAAIDADDGSALQHLVGEVLCRLPGSMRTVLMRAAVADELWPGLLAPLTGRRSGVRILEWLAGGHACVQRAAGAPGGLRIPALLRDLLAAELAFTDPAAFAAAHRAVTDWYTAAEQLPPAVARAVAGGDWAATPRLLVDDLAVVGVLARVGPPEVDLLATARPQPVGPDAALLRAAATLARTGVAAPADLAVALAVAADGSTRLGQRASAALLLASSDIGAGAHPDRTLDAIDAAERQMAGLAGVRPQRRAEAAAVLTTARASALLATDAADPRLIEAARGAEAACAAADTDRLRAGRLADLALLHALAGRLREADAFVAEYQALAESWDVPWAVRSPAAATAAAWVAAERGQAAETRRWAARAREAAGHRRGVFIAPLLAVLDSRRHRLLGRLDAAERVLASAPATARLPRWVREQLIAEQVRLRLARGDADALRWLDALAARSPLGGVLRATAVASGLAAGPRAVPENVSLDVSPVIALEARLVRAALLAADGSTAAAAAVLDEALHAAEPDRLRRPFLDAPPAARRVLRTHPGLTAARGWLVTIQPSPVPSGDGAELNAAPPLSDRERQALDLLATGMSTAGMAAAMGTTTNTTRGHLRSILRKLAATDRADAIRRATQRQLL